MNKKFKKAIQQFSQELTDDLLKDDEFSRGYKDALKDLMELIDKNERDSDNGYQETANPNKTKVQIEVEKLRVDPDGRIKVMYNSNVFSVSKEDVIE